MYRSPTKYRPARLLALAATIGLFGCSSDSTQARLVPGSDGTAFDGAWNVDIETIEATGANCSNAAGEINADTLWNIDVSRNRVEIVIEDDGALFAFTGSVVSDRLNFSGTGGQYADGSVLTITESNLVVTSNSLTGTLAATISGTEDCVLALEIVGERSVVVPVFNGAGTTHVGGDGNPFMIRVTDQDLADGSVPGFQFE